MEVVSLASIFYSYASWAASERESKNEWKDSNYLKICDCESISRHFLFAFN